MDLIVEPAEARQQSTIAKQIWLPIDQRNFGCDVSVGLPACKDSGGGGGESQGYPTGNGECHLFLGGNRMTIVAFEKEVSLESLSLFSKTIVPGTGFDCHV